MTDVVLFVFRRDLRIFDNLGLNKAISYCEENNCKLMVSFTFSKMQIGSNAYFSDRGFQFMINSLKDLNKSLNGKISFFEGEDFYQKLRYKVKAIIFNVDYTPYARKRDGNIMKYCKNNNIDCLTFDDYTLHCVNSIRTTDNKPYQMMTPFYRKCIKSFKVDKPSTNKISDVIIVKDGNTQLLKDYDKRIHTAGGRQKALNKLGLVKKGIFDEYKQKRNCISEENSTTELSAYIKFGCCSIRELYDVVKSRYGINNELLRQLYVKEFYSNIAYHFPDVLGKMIGKRNENMNGMEIDWSNGKNNFEKWKNGETGFPLVDAGMRQLNKTGFMHNRLRMVTASFLIKDLHIDWRKGEQYFAKQLIDYDPASNNGGWQWVAGTGTDSTPYFRIFNPWTQTKRFDKDCNYIKQWIPELNNVKNIDIIKWHKTYTMYPNVYLKPIVDHDEQKQLTLQMYKQP
uniref:Photolyase/cryptochrome alpha/beta domain-containing protein n=1 Tax=Pyramimonas orientalis virus TaxID=455367 RepID=A0A7M3UPB6_POV01|nr:hypothetical protein HWQ62_00464 [Pyramimonas orientalis virus]